ncbi:MAG TPA: thymidine phosphorylase [Burkholderiaceae bacterium]|nr:thymidine phosphorylase [Burkholderiaceae bacterium]
MPAMAAPAAPTTLRLRRIGIDTDAENVAYLARGCAACRIDALRAASKVAVSIEGAPAGAEPLLAVLNVVEDPGIVGPEELGLSRQAFALLGAPEGTALRIAPAPRPGSLDGVRRKLQGEPLDLAAMRAIARDILARRYTRSEIAAFLVACGRDDLERDEVLALTRAMLETGERLDWREPLVADKHCIGGIPGNRTSMIVVPIVAAHGMLIPKTSSRAITSPAGTADTMEVLAEVELPMARLRGIVERERGCLAWGGTARLAPIDDLLISVERPLALDSPGLMVASILAKKLAAGATRLLLDIPVGPSAKVRSLADAQRLRKTFEHVGRATPGRHRVDRVGEGVESHQRGHRVIGRVDQAEARCGDHTERALAAAQQPGQVAAGVVLHQAGETADHVAGAEHRFDTDQLLASAPVTQQVDAAGVGGDRPADRGTPPSAAGSTGPT